MRSAFLAAASLAALALPGCTTALPESASNLERRSETVSCFNIGTAVSRDFIIPGISAYCEFMRRPENSYFSNGRVDTERVLGSPSAPGASTLYITAAHINGCGPWTVDSNCERILYTIMDDCDTDTVTQKQGGVLTDNCGRWTLDPGTGASSW
ncbi:hypothetical protein DL96DRAFT_1818953 [Flagelloscypha sp. PMI_526]|nr:hypothetical protein DL96DRAFT_1818953 [Flagelloscypha sp. PMI_526]